MSPAEELRRAGERLRRRVELLPDDARAPWRQVLTDSESASGIGICAAPDHEELTACDDCWTVETYSEWLAAYLVSMWTGVGLLLADLLIATADNLAQEGRTWIETDTESLALRIARVVIGEEER